MTKNEFCSQVSKLLGPMGSVPVPTDADYKVIEYVYAFHPAISETEGKQQIAELYARFGMVLIRDLLPRAQLVEKKEAELREAGSRLKKLQQEMEDIKNGC